MTSHRPDPRLLSHRLRGFDAFESTARGMKRALEAKVHHVEFDLRVSRDEQLIAYHDPAISVKLGTWRFIDELSLAELRQAADRSSLATLDEMCEAFVADADQNTLIHVDVKVAGYEALIRDTLETHGLLERTVLVSWIPSVLRAFHALERSVPLCFSHLTLTRAPWSLRTVKALGRETTIASLARIMARPLPDLSRELSSVRLHVAADGDPRHELQGTDRVRSNHGVVVPNLISGTMLQILQATKGYVCVPLMLATAELGARYRQLGIRLAVFSTKTTRQTLDTLHRIEPDIIYVDAAEVFDEVHGS